MTELITLGRTLQRRATGVLAYFDPPAPDPRRRPAAASNTLRGTALGLRNLPNYIVRSLLETGALIPQLHPSIWMSHIRTR